MWKFSFLLIISFFFSTQLFGQVIPQDQIIPICDSQSITTGAPGNSGIYNLSLSCNPGQPLSPFMDFYYVRILSGTTFTFLVTPVGQDDYDFGAWKNPNWNNINATPAANKRGSQNDPFQTMEFSLGLSLTATDLCETGGSTGIPEPGKVKYFDVQAGDEILIAIDRWSNTTQGYTISFGGDAILDCTVLGNSYGKCDEDNDGAVAFISNDLLPDLNNEYPNHNFKFYLTQAAAENGTGAQVTFPFVVNYNNGDPTNLYVRVTNAQGGFIKVLKVFLYVNKVPDLLTAQLDLPTQCDPDGDGFALFNLTQSQTSLVANPGNYTFKYYTSHDDALDGTNNFIPNPTTYNSQTGTIYVRIETGEQDGNEEGCFVVAEIHLKVSDFNVAEQALTIDPICDEDGNGFVLVDLSQQITNFVANPADYQITYHTTQAQADAGTNAIANPTAYSINAGTAVTVYVRIQSLIDPCYSISKLNYSTLQKPILTTLTDVDQCVDEQQGNINFDLTQFAGQIVANPADYQISYHTSLADAEAGSNAIANPAQHPIPVNLTTTIFIRVENEGCPNVGSVNIKITSNPNLADDLEIGPLCDEDGDGLVSINLTETIAHFIANPNGFAISFHTNQQDAETGANPIANSTNYPINAGATTVIYIRVKSQLGDCFTVRSITYITTVKPILNDLTNVELCVEQTNGNYNYDLTQFATQVVGNPADFSLTYHTSLADAQNGVNPIANPAVYPIPVNSTAQIFIRVSNEACADVRSVSILIHSNPSLTTLPAQVFCTNEQNGNIPYDLTQHQSEWIANTAQYIFSYHTSLADAEADMNAIANPTAYLIPVGGTTTIFVRVENAQSACFSTTVLTLKPGATATLNENLEIELCDEDFDGMVVYNLSNLNPQLIANPNGLTFSYYQSEQQALNNQNPIPQNQWANYQMNNLPHSIWVVATTVDGCPSIPVKVVFKKGNKVSVLASSLGPIKYCPDEVLNLTDYQVDMTNETGVTFSYHNSLYDAQHDLNPIANSTQFHPNNNNSVFVRLEADGRCPDIVEIKVQKLPKPEISTNESLVELCPGSSFEAIVESDLPNVTFEWFLNDQFIGTGEQMNLTENGNYTVVVTSVDGCTNETNIVVVPPSSPQITGLEMGANYIIVSAVGGSGFGMMEYSLDQIFWQTSPRFDNLTAGETYTVYVRLNSCMIDSYTLVLLKITNFISPNNDGKNDTWEIRGMEVTPQATLKIFDRYGKIFVDTNFEGNYIWDGKYMGRSVASGDYWYIIDVPGDGIIKEQRFVGHISVRNR